MSGIVGLYRLDGDRADRSDLSRMAQAIAYRGPDGVFDYVEGRVGLGHLALRTMPEALHERLPRVDRTGDVVLTADARLDNRDELIGHLGLNDRPAGEITDGELILAAYRRWGEDCPKKLLGDFAFAIWDARANRLFCARDPMGIKPFYYHHSPRLFAFASDIGAILALPEVPRRLEERQIAYFIVWVTEDEATTFYKDVRLLPTGHTLSVSPDGLRTRRFWALDPHRELRLPSSEAYIEAFRDTFTRAVRDRLRGSGPVAAFLSGGLDSSSIVCTARDLSAKEGYPPLDSYSAIWPSLRQSNPESSEEKYMRAVIATGEFQPHYVHADEYNPLGAFLWDGDEPLAAPNAYMDLAIFDAASRDGARVILSGFDGDSVVGYGYGLLSDLARRGRWLELRKTALALQKTGTARAPTKRIMWERGFRPNIPESIVHIWRGLRRRESPGEVWRFLRGRSAVEWPIASPINPAFARRLDLEQHARALGYGRPESSDSRVAHAMGLAPGLLTFGLRCLEYYAARYGLDFRCPFRDQRLMELCAATPSSQKLRNGWTRALLRYAMDGVLPPEVQWRLGKANIGAHFLRAMLAQNRGTLDDLFLNHSEVLEEYFDVPALRAAYHRYVAAPMVMSSSDSMYVITAASLGLWLRRFGSAASPQIAEPGLSRT